MIPFGKPMLGAEEQSAVAEVLAGTTLTHGPRVKEFEAAFADFTRAPHAIATATCMASLHLAYLFLEVGAGDEVLVPAETHVAMAHAVQACDARPVFVDSEPLTGNVDLDQL
jgi:perosamine synthetase